MTAISSFTIAWGNVTFETSVGHAKAWLVSWWDFSYHNVPIIPKTVSISVDLYLLGTINYKKIKSFTTHNIKYFKIYLIQPKRIFEFYTVNKSRVLAYASLPIFWWSLAFDWLFLWPFCEGFSCWNLLSSPLNSWLMIEID